MTLNLEYCFSVKNFYIAKLFCSCNHVVNDYEVYKIIQEGSAEHNLFSYLQTFSFRSEQVKKENGKCAIAWLGQVVSFYLQNSS